MADKSLQKLEQELRARTPRNWGQSLDVCIQYANALLRGWLGYFGICDEKQLARLGRIDGHLRRRLRAIALKQWKRKRHIITRLSCMGVPVTTCTQSINSVGANALVARIYAKELGICGEGRTYGTGNASETICRFLDMGRELCVLAFHASRFPNSRGIFPDALVCGSAASSLRACKSGNCAAHCEEWFVGSSCG